MFKFKTPSKKTKEIMSEVALGMHEDVNYEQNALNKIKNLTGHENARITSSGNNSIFIALSSIEGDIIVPDQGGWHGFAGYCAEQDTKAISQYCKDKSITTIEDASAGIGDAEQKLGCGKYSDIIIASTGSPKIINVGSGGFITSESDEIFAKTSLPQKLSKTNQIICSGICVELENVNEKLELTVNATKHLKNSIDNTLHADKRGVNVIIPHANAKEISWKLKKSLPTDRSGFITTCPNYNRVKQKAIAIEVKNLAYDCLEKQYLEKIIEEINSLL